jgi:FixJ family two-component response regulator
MDQRDEGYASPAIRPARGGACVVVVCTDMSEADQIGRQLLELDTGCLVTYRKTEDLMYNCPASRVAIVILATDDAPPMLTRTLKWLGNRWPRCPITVVGDEGCGEHEIAARQGRASFLARPVSDRQWTDLLGHALVGPARLEENRPSRVVRHT